MKARPLRIPFKSEHVQTMAVGPRSDRVLTVLGADGHTKTTDRKPEAAGIRPSERHRNLGRPDSKDYRPASRERTTHGARRRKPLMTFCSARIHALHGQ
jgi:hypothetical protein